MTQPVLLAVLVALVSTASSEMLVQCGHDGLFPNRVVNLNERTIQTEIEVIEGQRVRERVKADVQ